MHKWEFVLENEMYTILWDFEIQTDCPILTRKLDVVLINKMKRICHLVDFAVPLDHIVKIKESRRIDKYLDLGKELKKM